MNFLEAIIIAIIEGLTEYLPVSSTAHMIFTNQILGVEQSVFLDIFQLCIQFGAILAVVTLYWKKFFDFRKFSFYKKLVFAVIPALILGKLFDEKIEAILEKPIPIAIVLVLGGIVLLFVDKWFEQPKVFHEDDITIRQAVIIGFWQCLAMMPGTSRSAASIIGGMQQKLSREVAAEFSFFLAVPTMLAVTVYSLLLKNWTENQVELKGYELLINNSQYMEIFIIGNIVAYVVAMLAIKGFVGAIKKYGFKTWGYYRNIVGSFLLIYFLM